MKATKEEVIGIVFSKLKPSKEDIFADIGCGTGSVSEFFAPYVKLVYAVDIDQNAIVESMSRLKKYENVVVMKLSGEEFLRKYEYDIVFFGGTKNIDTCLEIATKKASKIVVNAARIEVADEVIRKMKDLNVFKEALIVNVMKSYELAGLTAFKSLNPVFVIYGELK